jgi:hypothetical protein
MRASRTLLTMALLLPTHALLAARGDEDDRASTVGSTSTDDDPFDKRRRAAR